MVFEFIKYTQPGWVFNLLPKNSERFPSCYIMPEDLSAELTDHAYETLSAQTADAGFNLCNKGVMLQSSLYEIEKIKQLPKPTLKDEYTFLRKYWGSSWATFAFVLRIIGFKNIFQESKAFFSTRKIKKINVYGDHVLYARYENFHSFLAVNEPLVAVIIPTLNRYSYLKDALHDLEKQCYKNFEVLIVDQSDYFDADFYKQFSLNLKVRHQKEKRLWTARNNAVKNTKAEYLLFFDDDSRVEPEWIYEHLKCIDFFKADISAGVSLAVAGQKISESYNYFRWATQFDSGNAMLHRSVFEKIGLFDEQFNGMRMGDGEFSYRAYMHGLKSISNHKAPRIHLKVSEGGLREMGGWDAFRTKKWFAPKPIPSVIYLYKKYLPEPLYKNAVLIGTMLSNVSYKNKRHSKMLLWSAVLSILKSPVLFIQYQRSKRIAMNLLKNNYEPEILKCKNDSKHVFWKLCE